MNPTAVIPSFAASPSATLIQQLLQAINDQQYQAADHMSFTVCFPIGRHLHIVELYPSLMSPQTLTTSGCFVAATHHWSEQPTNLEQPVSALD